MRAWAKAKSLLQRIPIARHRRRVMAWSILLLVLAVAAVFVSRQFAIAGLRRDIGRIEAQRVTAEAEQKELRAGVASTSNKQRLEEEIRKRLGLVRPNEEKVFFIEEAGP